MDFLKIITDGLLMTYIDLVNIDVRKHDIIIFNS